MTLEEEIIMVAEAEADKCVTPLHRGSSLWQWKKKDFERAIKAWIIHKTMNLPSDNKELSMPNSNVINL